MASDNGAYKSFAAHCDENSFLFGPRGGQENSKFRKKCRDQLHRLRKTWQSDPSQFISLLKQNNLDNLAEGILKNVIPSPGGLIDPCTGEYHINNIISILPTKSEHIRSIQKAHQPSDIQSVGSIDDSSIEIYSSCTNMSHRERTEDGDCTFLGCLIIVLLSCLTYVGSYPVINVQVAFVYDLDFDDLKNNQGGVIPTYEPKLKINEYERCGKVTLAFIVDDLRD